MFLWVLISFIILLDNAEGLLQNFAFPALDIEGIVSVVFVTGIIATAAS